MAEIMAEFIEDAREHLQAASEHLLALEKDAGRLDDLNGMLRRLHTIKGNAGFLNLRSLYTLLHKAENILQGVREKNRADCPKDLIDVMFQVLDTVEIMIGQLAARQSDYVEWLDRLMVSLDRIELAMDLGSTAEDQPPPAAEEPPTSKDPTTSRTKSNPVPPTAGAIPAGAPPETPKSAVSLLVDRINSWRNRIKAGPTKLRDDSGADSLAELESIAAEVKARGWVKSRLATGMLLEYLLDLENRDPNQGSNLLPALIANLVAWVETEGSKTVTNQIITVDIADLEGAPPALGPKVTAAFAAGNRWALLDLRPIQTMHSGHIGVLISVLKTAPALERVGILIDPGQQAGLWRVFKVMGLDQVFRVFTDQAQAMTALG